MKTLLLIMALACSANAGQLSSSHYGLVGLWHFNEGTGTTTFDSTGKNVGATLSNTAWGSGLFGPAAYYGGTNSYISSPNDSDINFSSSFSISVWVKVLTFSNFRVIVDKGNDAAENYEIWCAAPSGGQNYCIFTIRALTAGGNATFGKVNTGIISIYPNTWYHFVAVYSATGYTASYINGRQNEKLAATGTPTTNTLPLYIGRCPSTGRYFHGYIEDLALYNRALSPGEIQRIYTAGLGRFSNAR